MPTLFAACEPFEDRRFTVHPIADSLTTPPDEATVVLSRGGGLSNGESAQLIAAFRERFERREAVETIGDMDGAESTTFALLWDAAITEAGEILVLDRIQTNVRVFSLNGEYLHTLGGPGEGPGELRVPEALVLDSGGDLLVVDQAQFIHRFRRRGERFEYLDRIRFEGEPRDACWAGNDLIIHGMRSGPEKGVLHRVVGGRRPESSFAVPYRYSAGLVYEMLSRGQLACGGAGRRVVIAYRLRNAIEAYDIADGALLWHARIDGLQPSEVRERHERRSVGTGIFDSDAVHFLNRVAGGGGVPVFVQYSYHLREDALNQAGRHTIETWALDPATGDGEYWGDALPSMLAVTDEYAVFSYDAPYPRIEVARIPK